MGATSGARLDRAARAQAIGRGRRSLFLPTVNASGGSRCIVRPSAVLAAATLAAGPSAAAKELTATCDLPRRSWRRSGRPGGGPGGGHLQRAVARSGPRRAGEAVGAAVELDRSPAARPSTRLLTSAVVGTAAAASTGGGTSGVGLVSSFSESRCEASSATKPKPLNAFIVAPRGPTRCAGGFVLRARRGASYTAGRRNASAATFRAGRTPRRRPGVASKRHDHHVLRLHAEVIGAVRDWNVIAQPPMLQQMLLVSEGAAAARRASTCPSSTRLLHGHAQRPGITMVAGIVVRRPSPTLASAFGDAHTEYLVFCFNGAPVYRTLYVAVAPSTAGCPCRARDERRPKPYAELMRSSTGSPARWATTTTSRVPGWS